MSALIWLIGWYVMMGISFEQERPVHEKISPKNQLLIIFWTFVAWPVFLGFWLEHTFGQHPKGKD